VDRESCLVRINPERSVAMSVASPEKYWRSALQYSLRKENPIKRVTVPLNFHRTTPIRVANSTLVRRAFANMGMAGLCMIGSSVAIAQQSPVTTLGIGAAAVPRYEGSSSYHATPFPILSASRGIFFVDGLEGGIAYDLGDHVKVGALLSAEFGRDESDGSRLKGLGDIDTTAGYGAFVRWQDGAFDASAKYLQSAHSGYGATLALAAKYKLVLDPRDNVAFEADSTFANQKSMQTFFGVTPAQSAHGAAGLPAFSPSAGFKRVSTSATWVHILTPAWSVNGSVGVGRLLGDASASPVTEHSTWIFGGVGVAYSF
jgi:outer membrane protein